MSETKLKPIQANDPNLLAYRMRAYLNTQLTITNADQYYTVVYDVESYDEGSNYNNSTGVYTVPATGVYLLVANVNVSGNTNDDFFLSLFIGTTSADAVRFQKTSNTRDNKQLVVCRYFTAGDELTIQVYNNTSASTFIDTGTRFSFLEIQRIA